MFFRKKVVIDKDVTLLLQGVPNEECLNLWIENYSQWNVIISTWDNVDLTPYKIPKKWKVVQSEVPIFRYYSHVNLDYQLHTTIKGLELVKTDFVIKARLDEYWSNLHRFKSIILKNTEKIVCSSMYFRTKGFSDGKYKFHIGDKIIAGTIDNVRLMFESTLHNLQIHFWDNHNPEGQLGLGYVMGKEPNLDWEKIKLSLIASMKDKPTETDLVKNLNSIITNITKAAVHISTQYLSFMVKSLDWVDIHKKVKEITGQINWINSELDTYHQMESFDDSQLLKKWFEIEDINNLKPYVSTRNFRDERGRVWYRSQFNHRQEECVNNIKDY